MTIFSSLYSVAGQQEVWFTFRIKLDGNCGIVADRNYQAYTHPRNSRPCCLVADYISLATEALVKQRFIILWSGIVY